MPRHRAWFIRVPLTTSRPAASGAGFRNRARESRGGTERRCGIAPAYAPSGTRADASQLATHQEIQHREQIPRGPGGQWGP